MEASWQSLVSLSIVVLIVLFFLPRKWKEKAAAVFEMLVLALPHWRSLLPHLHEILPHSLELLQDVEKVAPLTEAIFQEKEHLLPNLPVILKHQKQIVERIDILAPRMHLLAPHADVLCANIDVILLHVDSLAPFIDQYLPFLECKGWDQAIPYLDQLEPYISELAPHSEIVVPHFDKLLPHLPILCKYLPYLDVSRTAEVIDRLLPFLWILPIVDVTGLLRSRLICGVLPHVGQVLPRMRLEEHSRKKRTIEHPFEVNCIKITSIARDSHGIVFYSVVLNEKKTRKFRFRQLFQWNLMFFDEISNFTKLNLRMHRFPSKTWLPASEEEVIKRELLLQNYFDGLVKYQQDLVEESANFRRFLREF